MYYVLGIDSFILLIIGWNIMADFAWCGLFYHGDIARTAGFIGTASFYSEFYGCAERMTDVRIARFSDYIEQSPVLRAGFEAFNHELSAGSITIATPIQLDAAVGL